MLNRDEFLKVISMFPLPDALLDEQESSQVNPYTQV